MARPDSTPQTASAEATHNRPVSEYPDLLGMMVLNYEVVGKIADGGMGAVFEGKYKSERVAIKVYPQGLAQRLKRENLIGRRLRHSAVAAVLADGIYEAGPGQGEYPFIVIEHIDGKTLAERIDSYNGAFSVSEALHLAHQIALGMYEVHRNNLTHLDLKPSNIMLACDESSPIGIQAKIIDFGLAQIRDESKQGSSQQWSLSENKVLGTAAYMAPEIFIRKPGSNWRSGAADVYSLGVILYELLSGHRPFMASSDNWPTLNYQHTEITPRALHERYPHIPSTVSALVASMLAKEPSQRPEMSLVAKTLFREIALADAIIEEPYPGLAGFSFSQARYFCGRDDEQTQALRSLAAAAERRTPWLHIEGDARVGKSSFARASLLPALMRGKEPLVRASLGVPETATCTLGMRPLESLAAILAIALQVQDQRWAREPPTSADVYQRLLNNRSALRDLVREWQGGSKAQCFALLIDPLEDLLDAPPDIRNRIDGLLHAALTDTAHPFILITTSRRASADRLSDLPSLSHELPRAARFPLGRMSTAQVRSAVLLPAARAGISVEPQLADSIAQDSQAPAIDSALLAFTLRILWQLRSGNALNEEIYRSLGGVSKSLSWVADRALDTLLRAVQKPAYQTRAAQELVEDRAKALALRIQLLFTALVKPSLGDAHELRLLPRCDAEQIAGGDLEGPSPLNLLTEGRIEVYGQVLEGLPLIKIRPSTGREPEVVTLGSSLLLTHWESLRQWVVRDSRVLGRWMEVETAAQKCLDAGNTGALSEEDRAYYRGAGLEAIEKKRLHLLLSANGLKLIGAQRPTPIEALLKKPISSSVSDQLKKSGLSKLEITENKEPIIHGPESNKVFENSSIEVAKDKNKTIFTIVITVSLSALAAFTGWKYWIEPADTVTHHVEPPVPVTPPAPVPAPPKPIPKPIPEPEPVPPPRPTPPPPGAQYEARGGPMAFVSGDSPSANVKPFLLDITEVTVNAYRQCVAERGCVDLTPTIEAIVIDENVRQRCNWLHADERANHPINCLNFKQAQAFCRWAGKRIPMETEWLFATRGLAGRAFPWGDQPPRPRQDICWFRRETTCPVDDPSTEMDRSVFGIQGLAGNVGEFTTDGTETNRGIAPFRGGSYATDASERLLLQDNPPSYIKRRIHLTDGVQNTVGVRCAGDGQLVEKLKRIK